MNVIREQSDATKPLEAMSAEELVAELEKAEFGELKAKQESDEANAASFRKRAEKINTLLYPDYSEAKLEAPRVLQEILKDIDQTIYTLSKIDLPDENKVEAKKKLGKLKEEIAQLYYKTEANDAKRQIQGYLIKIEDALDQMTKENKS